MFAHDDQARAVCEQKAFYTSAETARSMGRLLGLEPYVCRCCRLWHLATPRGQRRSYALRGGK
jgi:hypothetical protein